jgi:hypothetical protein
MVVTIALFKNCISQFRVSALWHFGTPVVKCLDSPCRGARNSETEFVCEISRLQVSLFRDSSDEEYLLLTPNTLGIRNSGMESLSFLNFGFRDFGTPYDESLCHFHLPVSEIPVSNTPSDAHVLGFRISELRDS